MRIYIEKQEIAEIKKTKSLIGKFLHIFDIKLNHLHSYKSKFFRI